MNSFPMLTKEVKEWFTSYKILIIPIVFIFLTIVQPISIKMLPTLIANSTELPEGSIIEIPTPPVTQIMGTVIRKFDIMGFFVTIMIVMGTIAGERASGVAAMVLVKPISRARYFFAKAVSYNLLVSIGFITAMLVTGYYTEVLFETPLNWSHILYATLLFLPNLFLVVSITICCSAFLKSPVGAGGLGFGLALVLNYLPQYLGLSFKKLSPLGLSENAVNIIEGLPYELTMPLVGSLCLNGIFLIVGWQLFRNQEI